MKYVYIFLPLVLLTACNLSGSQPPQDSAQNSPASDQLTAPAFPNLMGEWHMEVFARSSEESMGTPNLQGTLTWTTGSDGYPKAQYVATVRDDEQKANPSDTRTFYYTSDYAVWNASKQWNPTAHEWVGSERIDFNLRAHRVDGTAENDPSLPLPLDCSIFASSRVKQPKSGKETYVFTCKANYKLDGWMERR